ncbi:MAG: PspC domain-containing protein [Hyphomonadaceae bacterium]
METVVTVNLNGVAYQLETSAHAALAAYLDRARVSLAANPDKDEIVRDLEQAIGDKARAYLNAHKNVLLGGEMSTILQEMGPVSEEAESAESAQSDAPRMGASGPIRRLYRIKDGAWIDGVCSGMGAYFDIDANLIRLLWVLAAVFTGGFIIIVYIIMMFAIPSANTREEWAQAHGVAFNAQEVIERAKRQYAEFEERGGWRGEWRNIRNSFRGRDGFQGYSAPPAQPAKPVGYVTRVFAGLLALITGIVGVALTIAFIVAILSIAAQGNLLGWPVPINAPNWLVIIILCLVFAAISLPLAGMRRASFDALSGRQGEGRRGGDGFSTVLIIALILGLIWLFTPASHTWFGPFPSAIENVWDNLTMNF